MTCTQYSMLVAGQPAAPVWQCSVRYRGMYAYGRLNADLGRLYHHSLTAPSTHTIHSDYENIPLLLFSMDRALTAFVPKAYLAFLSDSASKTAILALQACSHRRQQHGDVRSMYTVSDCTFRGGSLALTENIDGRWPRNKKLKPTELSGDSEILNVIA